MSHIREAKSAKTFQTVQNAHNSSNAGCDLVCSFSAGNIIITVIILNNFKNSCLYSGLDQLLLEEPILITVRYFLVDFAVCD